MFFHSLNALWYRLFFGARQRLKVYRSLATLLQNHVPLKPALLACADVYGAHGKKPNRIEAIVLQDCLSAIDQGRALAEALRRWLPFDEYSAIAAGQRSARLAEALLRAAEMIRRKGRMHKAVIHATAYPAMLLLALGASFYLIAAHMMPKLLRMMPSQQWSASVRALDWIAQWVARHGALLLMGMGALVCVIWISLPRLTGRIRVMLDALPPWNMYRIVHGASFLYNIGVLLSADVPKVELLGMMRAHATPYLRERIDGALRGIKDGLDLGRALAASGHRFPSADAIAYIRVIGSLKGGDAQLKQFSEEWLEESIAKLNVAAAIFKQSAIALGGLMIMMIVAGVNGIGSGMMMRF
ncbi:putative Type II secretion system protein [Candidatus Glomeribacter gigasporarum BEG34]|uniref:Putative Type II secretion system protein n=1 Tax=Candidatus Glomeribacter gigasporarum BEG34 TaxID=1070319 RepID=G2J7P7_9BURK|nr:type II secretion system F family protein [Candidatus Glomeribacter gigasporarum]CCD28792.1 putative Type II secretion system protein [Candidatus Glomeribacter gigasporarum BEG34]